MNFADVFAWYQAANNATVSTVTDTKTAVVIGSSASTSQVKFTCVAGTPDYTNDVNNAATGLVLTNTSGKTGYVNNGYVYIRDLKDSESGYATVTVTVTATLDSGDGTFYSAWQSLSSQSTKIYPKLIGAGMLRPNMSAATYTAYTEGDAVYGSDIFSSFKDSSDGTSAISSTTTSAVATYTCYFSIAPKFDGDKANGAAMGNASSYDAAADHDTEDVLTVNVSTSNS